MASKKTHTKHVPLWVLKKRFEAAPKKMKELAELIDRRRKHPTDPNDRVLTKPKKKAHKKKGKKR